jgi:hypothetical protein
MLLLLIKRARMELALRLALFLLRGEESSELSWVIGIYILAVLTCKDGSKLDWIVNVDILALDILVLPIGDCNAVVIFPTKY